MLVLFNGYVWYVAFVVEFKNLSPPLLTCVVILVILVFSEVGFRYRAFSKPSMVEHCYRPASNLK